MSIGMAEEMDDMWHQFILFTENYRNFCAENFGQYIDHVPCGEGIIDLTTGKPATMPTDGFGNFCKVYEEMFGEAPPEDVWPRSTPPKCGKCCNRCGCACNWCGRCH